MVDEAMLIALSAYADGELDMARRAAVEAALAADGGLRAQLAALRKLERAAAELPVPRLEADAGAALWEAIVARTAAGAGQVARSSSPAQQQRLQAALPAVPQVSATRWEGVWTGIRARIKAAPAQAAPRPVHEPWRRHIPLWRAGLALAAAAAVLLALTLTFLRQEPITPPGQNVTQEPEPPAVLSDRYFVMVKHVPGIETPVVCFFLKDPESELRRFHDGANWD